MRSKTKKAGKKMFLLFLVKNWYKLLIALVPTAYVDHIIRVSRGEPSSIFMWKNPFWITGDSLRTFWETTQLFSPYTKYMTFTDLIVTVLPFLIIFVYGYFLVIFAVSSGAVFFFFHLLRTLSKYLSKKFL